MADAYCANCAFLLFPDCSCDPDCFLEHQRLREEIRQAYLNGGRTGWLYDIDGNEYYTTRDGVRHYTRVEG